MQHQVLGNHIFASLARSQRMSHSDSGGIQALAVKPLYLANSTNKELFTKQLPLMVNKCFFVRTLNHRPSYSECVNNCWRDGIYPNPNPSIIITPDPQSDGLSYGSAYTKRSEQIEGFGKR